MIQGANDVFSFDSVDFDKTSLVATLKYSCGIHSFSEIIRFKDVIEPKNIDSASLGRALQLLHLTAGISYYKAFINDAKEMSVSYPVSIQLADYLNHIYEEGLGEFFYVNRMDPVLPARFSSNQELGTPNDITAEGYVCGLGGGKDSLVAIEMLRSITDKQIATFGVNASQLLKKQAEVLKTKHFQVERQVDIASLKALSAKDGQSVPNGHVPISAILAAVGIVGAIITERSQVVVAVERSANEPTVLDYKGKSINHQYSKTSDFENQFDSTLKNWVSPQLGFFSVLRPLRELEIMRLFFLTNLHTKFENLYSSCNRSIAFTQGSDDSAPLWCGHCDKCAFIFLLMAGAGKYEYAVSLFGSDLIANPDLRSVYQSLLGLSDTKLFDCVGEIDEARQSMDEAKKYSDAAQSFEYPPASAEPEVWNSGHSIPANISEPLKAKVLEILTADRP